MCVFSEMSLLVDAGGCYESQTRVPTLTERPHFDTDAVVLLVKMRASSGMALAARLTLQFVFGRDRKLFLDLKDFLRCVVPEKTLHVGCKFAQEIANRI